MFDTMKRARADLATMNAVLPAAERIARDEGLEEPGAEHLLLAALDLPDGIARDALGEFGIDQAALQSALASQHAEALRAIGVVADDVVIDSALPSGGQPSGPYESQGSLQTAFQSAVAMAKQDRLPMNSGHVLLAVTDPDRGTVARALARAGIDRTALRERTLALLHP